MELDLHSDLIYENHLDTDRFARMLDDPSQCYKFYWLGAIISLTAATDNDISFDQIINEMICDVWYTVTKYHLHLGPTIKGKSENFLEHAIKTLEEKAALSPSATRADILEAIEKNEASIKNDKMSLIIYVPYRLLSSFLDAVGGGDRIWDQHRRLIAYIEAINKDTPLLYTIIDGKSLQKRIRLNKYWRQLILDNYSVIVSWIQLKKVRFLQDRNPGVPGIIYKLSQENESARKLGNARELWKCAANTGAVSIRDIYTGKSIETTRFDLDHFVPWSYVANDELWNLLPMERRLNSSKSNKLPEWDKYFSGLATMQFSLYEAIFAYPVIRMSFEKCRRDNLNAIWASETLYVEGNSREQFTNILEHNLKPIYDSAHLQGYSFWKFPDLF